MANSALTKDALLPLKAAAIDIGSNALRLEIASVGPMYDLTVLDRLRAPVRLGDAVFKNGLSPQPIPPDSISQIVSFFGQCVSLIDEHKVSSEAVVAVATSAVRQAPNKQE